MPVEHRYTEAECWPLNVDDRCMRCGKRADEKHEATDHPFTFDAGDGLIITYE